MMRVSQHNCAWSSEETIKVLDTRVECRAHVVGSQDPMSEKESIGINHLAY